MNLIATLSRRGRLIAVSAFLFATPIASVSRAAVVAADTFTRADDTALGSTEVGSYPWSERFTNGSAADIAEISGGTLLLSTSGSELAVLPVNLSNLTASATLRFTSDPAPADTATTKSLGMVFRGSNMDLQFVSDAANVGLVTIQFTNSGGLLVGENGNAGLWHYIDNPFNEAGLNYDNYGAAGVLPTTINGSPFDADGDGRLSSDEPFQIGAVLAGTSLDVTINGLTIKSVTLDNASGLTGNYFAFLRNNLGGAGNEPTGAFDDLVLSVVPEPSGFTLFAIGLIAIAGRARRSH